MTYLIVGLDRRTLAPWHRNVLDRARRPPHEPLSPAPAPMASISWLQR